MVLKPSGSAITTFVEMLSEFAHVIRNDQDLLNLYKFENKVIIPEEFGPFVERCNCGNAVSVENSRTGKEKRKCVLILA